MLCMSELRVSRAGLLIVVLDHLKALLKDLETCQRNGDWRDIPNVRVPIYHAGMVALREIVNALEMYFITKDSTKLHQELISAGMNFTTRWDIWLQTLSPGDLKWNSAKVFHEYLLRFTKGALKSYRIWRIDTAK